MIQEQKATLSVQTITIIRDIMYRWDCSGFRAQFNKEKVLIYQATSNENAESALKHQSFDYCFNFDRSTWLKTSYFWMMHNSKWATNKNQERILGVQIKKDFFDKLLRKAIAFQPLPKIYSPLGFWDVAWNDEKLRQKLARESEISVQLDPERDYLGFKRGIRAIQIRIKGETLKNYSSTQILSIEDLTELSKENHRRIYSGRMSFARVPIEEIYPF